MQSRGKFALDPRLRHLFVDAKPVVLGARAFDVLMMLIEERHRILTKEELLERVWAGRVVEENNLATQVSTLRKLLGDGAIKTIPGRGYKFTMTVRCRRVGGAEGREGDDAGELDYELGGLGEERSALPAESADGVPRAGLPTTDPATTNPPTVGQFSASSAPIGRAELFAQLRAALLAPATKDPVQLTLLGPGGVGKTCLAQALCQALPAGRWAWLDLRAAGTLAGLARQLAQAAAGDGAADAAPVDDLPGDPAHPADPPDVAQWAAWLAALPPPAWQLLVLDQAEVLAAGLPPLLQALAAQWPQVPVLLTSQWPLRQPGEQRWPVGPLALPPADAPWEEARSAGAIACFEQAARAQDRRWALQPAQWPTLHRICSALGGLPLALRLAAARLPLLGLDGLAAALDQRLSLLVAPASGAGTPVDPRHHSLRAVLDWSFELLPDDARALWLQLAIGRGEVSLAVANRLGQQLAQAPDARSTEAQTAEAQRPDPQALDPEVMDRLDLLLTRGLLALAPAADTGRAQPLGQAAPGDALPSYRLPETHRLYALDKLRAQGQRAAAAQRWGAAVQQRLADAEASYWTLPDADWLSQFAPDLPALRDALDGADPAAPGQPHELLASSTFLWLQCGLAGEARQRWQALASQPPAEGTVQAAQFALAGCRLHWGVDPARVERLARQALETTAAAGAAGQAAPSSETLDRLRYQAWRCLLGSGQLAADEAQHGLQQMARLEQAAWPPRLRAQRLLAQVDHLAFGPLEVSISPSPSPSRRGGSGHGHAAGVSEHQRLAELAQARAALRELADAAGLQTLASLARIGLAESEVLAGRWLDAAGACQALRLSPRPALSGNQLLQAGAVEAAARLALWDQALRADPAQDDAAGPGPASHEAAGHAARQALARLAQQAAQRRWEWFAPQAGLYAWGAALQAQAHAESQALTQAHALAALVGRSPVPGGVWSRWLTARWQAALQRLPAADGPIPWLADAPALLDAVQWLQAPAAEPGR